ncbi:hypothetical protein KC19_VG183600 [Ceratodon purpureus]|uniref:Uncharacterized protein n=1 Tax=Ceratodon purpureus TaxID=3225 RepID=A0A8T0HRT7_CERPU|nr:hypothetical protein KC19_VG183600 [Ceratodon purpureus]
MEGGVVDLVQELPFEEVRRQAHLKRAMAATAGKRRKDKKAVEIDAVKISAEEIHAEVERKKAKKARRAREKKEKQQRAAFRAKNKLRLVQALQAKLDAQRGKKNKLPVTPLPAGELKRKEAVKQKTMTEMFLFTGRNLPASSDPISSSSGSEPEGSAFVVASPAPQQEVVTVSSDTMLPSDSGSGFTDSGQVGVLGLSCEGVDQCKRKASNVVHLSLEPEGHDSDLPEDLDLSNLQELTFSDSDEEDDFEDSSPAAKKRKKDYDSTRKFQEVWAVKLPWAEGILGSDGVLHMVKCNPCTIFNKKPCIMAPKWDMLVKHKGRRTTDKDIPKYGVKKGQFYISSDCKHRKNMRLYIA